MANNSRRPKIIPNIKTHLGPIPKLANVSVGPISDPNPVPRLPRADAAPDKHVIKSNPKADNPPANIIRQNA